VGDLIALVSPPGRRRRQKARVRKPFWNLQWSHKCPTINHAHQSPDKNGISLLWVGQEILTEKTRKHYM
ncbi:hypothetical protein NDU88_002668, partial [Pleurodeles waltl]